MSWLNKSKEKKKAPAGKPAEDLSEKKEVKSASAKAPADKAAPAKDDKAEKKEEGKKSEAKKDPLAKKAGKSERAARHLVRPIISEKAARLAETGKYMFEVSVNSNKIDIKKSIKELYGVQPEGVNVMNVRGKQVRWGKHFGKRKNWRRAIVTIKKGQSIDLYEGV